VIVCEIIVHMLVIVQNACVTWQGIDYRLSEDDTSVETCSSVIICEIIVHMLVIVQNACVTGQGIDYKLSEDDTIVSKHVAV
jgi:hypothetical protein